jgi:hypothetical protein
VHLLEEGRITRVVFDVLQQRITFNISETGIALGVSALQPLERPVGLTPEGIKLGNLEGGTCLILGDVLRQGRVRVFLRPSA